jgi:hypothetical protein
MVAGIPDTEIAGVVEGSGLDISFRGVTTCVA